MDAELAASLVIEPATTEDIGECSVCLLLGTMPSLQFLDSHKLGVTATRTEVEAHFIDQDSVSTSECVPVPTPPQAPLVNGECGAPPPLELSLLQLLQNCGITDYFSAQSVRDVLYFSIGRSTQQVHPTLGVGPAVPGPTVALLC